MNQHNLNNPAIRKVKHRKCGGFSFFRVMYLKDRVTQQETEEEEVREQEKERSFIY